MEETPLSKSRSHGSRSSFVVRGGRSEIVWRREDEIFHCLDHQILVRRRVSAAAAAEARTNFEEGRGQGVGVELRAYCQLVGAACAVVYWTADSDEAARHLMPEQGLKLVVAVPRLEGRSASAFAFWRER